MFGLRYIGNEINMNAVDRDVADLCFLDCTLRDGGYYNDWDFPSGLVNDYLVAMKAAGVDVVEIGFRFLSNNGFKGPYAFSSDEFLRSLDIPDGITLGVMVNGSDLLSDIGLYPVLEHLFPNSASASPVGLVRIACHAHEVEGVLPAVDWLVGQGYRVGVNLMQITECSREQIISLARKARERTLEVLYFADSLGSLTPANVGEIVRWFRDVWDGPLGIHTHDNMGLALSNTLRAQADGVTWLDSTVTGMGRGPGNARTEELMVEIGDLRGTPPHMKPVMKLIRDYFAPLKEMNGWGSNPYFFLSGKYSIHPTYVQQMLADQRFSDDDIIAVLEHLRAFGGKSFSRAALEGARAFYTSEPQGTWSPRSVLSGRQVMILGTGPGVSRHRHALESFILRSKPIVIAMNTQTSLSADLIDYRVACHPVRLMADSEALGSLPQPLITPATMMPSSLKSAFEGKELLDFGMLVEGRGFSFGETHCRTPSSLVLAYSLAIAASGNATSILMAGFDGYAPGDPRNNETAEILAAFEASADLPLLAVTPTRHQIASASIYAL